VTSSLPTTDRRNDKTYTFMYSLRRIMKEWSRGRILHRCVYVAYLVERITYHVASLPLPHYQTSLEVCRSQSCSVNSTFRRPLLSSIRLVPFFLKILPRQWP
jgi:hypothetical protein